jgi:hypothetical protein
VWTCDRHAHLLTGDTGDTTAAATATANTGDPANTC